MTSLKTSIKKNLFLGFLFFSVSGIIYFHIGSTHSLLKFLGIYATLALVI